MPTNPTGDERVETEKIGTLAVEVEMLNTLLALLPTIEVTLPVFDIENSVVVEFCVEEPMAKSVWFVSPLFVWIENCAYGEVEAMPMSPVAVIISRTMLLVTKLMGDAIAVTKFSELGPPYTVLAEPLRKNAPPAPPSLPKAKEAKPPAFVF